MSSGKYWCREEKIILRAEYPNGAYAASLALFSKGYSRAISAIRVKAKKMKLNLSPEAMREVRMNNLRKSEMFVDYSV